MGTWPPQRAGSVVDTVAEAASVADPAAAVEQRLKNDSRWGEQGRPKEEIHYHHHWGPAKGGREKKHWWALIKTHDIM